MQKFLSFTLGALMGALVGATVAILLAPSSGEEMRGQIRERTYSLRDELTEAAQSKRIELEKQLQAMRQPKKAVPAETAKG
ncbi:MAG: YtxH domain-containing protein [Anaerolineales bacterium]|nr:YtxH domain-containing protein [Anaerolineales bacterium]